MRHQVIVRQRTPPWGSVAALLLVVGVFAVACGRCCVEKKVEIGGFGGFCLPQPALAGADVSFLLLEGGCKSSSCTSEPQCEVRVREGVVEARFRHADCSGFAICTSDCANRVAVCTVPQLPEGDYEVEVNGEGVGILEVRPGGSVSCGVFPHCLADEDCGRVDQICGLGGSMVGTCFNPICTSDADCAGAAVCVGINGALTRRCVLADGGS